MNKSTIERTLASWTTFNTALTSLRIKDLQELIDHEMLNKNRESYIKRLVIRQNKLIGDARLKSILMKP